MSDDKLLKFLNMTKEEYEKTMDSFAEKMVQEEYKKIQSMHEKRHTLLPLMIQHLKEKGSIDGETISYFPNDYPFTAKEFQDFFSLATDCLEVEHGYLEDEECDFENKVFFLRHDGILLEFFIMWGQGTCTILKICEEEEDVPVESIGSFEKWIAYIEKQYEAFKNEMVENKNEKVGE